MVADAGCLYDGQTTDSYTRSFSYTSKDEKADKNWRYRTFMSGMYIKILKELRQKDGCCFVYVSRSLHIFDSAHASDKNLQIIRPD